MLLHASPLLRLPVVSITVQSLLSKLLRTVGIGLMVCRPIAPLPCTNGKLCVCFRAVLKQPNLEPPWQRPYVCHGARPMHTSGQWGKSRSATSDRREAGGSDGSSSLYLSISKRRSPSLSYPRRPTITPPRRVHTKLLRRRASSEQVCIRRWSQSYRSKNRLRLIAPQ